MPIFILPLFLTHTAPNTTLPQPLTSLTQLLPPQRMYVFDEAVLLSSGHWFYYTLCLSDITSIHLRLLNHSSHSKLIHKQQHGRGHFLKFYLKTVEWVPTAQMRINYKFTYLCRRVKKKKYCAEYTLLIVDILHIVIQNETYTKTLR